MKDKTQVDSLEDLTEEELTDLERMIIEEIEAHEEEPEGLYTLEKYYAEERTKKDFNISEEQAALIDWDSAKKIH